MNKYFSLLSFLIACGGESVIEKQQNSAPTIMIGSHSPDAEILEGYAETFRASVSDDNNTYEELTVAWYVGENLVCDWETVSPAGESFCDITFDTEDNNVIAEVRDPDGAGGRAELSVVIVPTSAPTAEITNPVQNTNHYSDQLILFAGIVGDNEDNSEDLIVTWTSSLDGELILDTTPDSNGVVSDYGYLTEGQHALELRVEDSSGKTTREQLVIQVGGANETPDCELLSPLPQTAFQVGEEIVFEGLASDANIDANELDVVFSSDRDGELGVGTINSNGEITYINNQLSNNSHVISMTVTDDVGASCLDTVVLQVGTPPSVLIDEPLSGEVYSVGTDILFSASFQDAEDPMTDIDVSWSSSLNGVIATGNPNSQGTHQFSINDLDAGLHTISLTGTDSTGLTGSDTISLRVNTPPTTPSITLSPSPLYSDTPLVVTVTGSNDADGDPVTTSIEWYEDGVLQSTTATTIPASSLDVGEVWTVRVTPNDGYTNGTFAEQSIVVANSLPTITTPVISSNNGGNYNDSTLTCAATASDMDETVVPSYTWDVNGNTYSGSTLDLSSTSVNIGDSVTCTAMVTDSNGGSDSASTSSTIENRSPIISTVSISPSNPNSQDVLSCSVSATDPDGDVLTESYSWTLSGSTVGSGATLDLSSVGASTGDTVECMASVTDGHGGSDTQSTSITLATSSPVFDTPATITPNVVEIGTNVSCTAVASDPDDGVASLSYIWNINGSQVATGSTWTVNSNDASVGDDLSCTALAVDYAGNTTASTSSVVTISNTAPTVSNVVLDNTSPYTNDSISVSGTTFDFNGDTVTLQYEWHVIDASQGGQDLVVYVGTNPLFASLDGSQSYAFDKGDEVYAVVTPNDGSDNGTSVESDHAFVQNSAPTAPTVSVTSATTPPLEGVDDLTCMITTVSTDPDGDSIDYTFNWYDANGTNAQTLANTTNTVDIFPGTQTTAGLWECDVTASDGSLTSNGFADIEIDADWAGALNFTNCSQTGRTGPSQSQCDTEYSGSTLDGLVTVSAGYQTWIVPSTGTYNIEIAGAAGGSYSYPAGYGAMMSGDFDLIAGDEITIVVGQTGDVGGQGGGGGGGTFVALNQNTPLIIAGGGGGSHYNQGGDTAQGGGTGTTGPAVSSTGTGYTSGSGGGWFSDGANGDYGTQGGKSWANGLTGGTYASSSGSGNHWSNGDGGFGGGGGGCWPGGSAGGYNGGVSANSGGNQTPGGAGGGSFNSGNNQVNTSDTNTGHGYVYIDKL